MIRLVTGKARHRQAITPSFFSPRICIRLFGKLIPRLHTLEKSTHIQASRLTSIELRLAHLEKQNADTNKCIATSLATLETGLTDIYKRIQPLLLLATPPAPPTAPTSPAETPAKTFKLADAKFDTTTLKHILNSAWNFLLRHKNKFLWLTLILIMCYLILMLVWIAVLYVMIGWGLNR